MHVLKRYVLKAKRNIKMFAENMPLIISLVRIDLWIILSCMRV